MPGIVRKRRYPFHTFFRPSSSLCDVPAREMVFRFTAFGIAAVMSASAFYIEGFDYLSTTIRTDAFLPACQPIIVGHRVSSGHRSPIR
jgi:hypothetical protein